MTHSRKYNRSDDPDDGWFAAGSLLPGSAMGDQHQWADETAIRAALDSIFERIQKDFQVAEELLKEADKAGMAAIAELLGS